MASPNVAASEVRPQSSSEAGPRGLVSIGKVSKELGIHVASIRRLDHLLPSYVLPSGHRRYRVQEVIACLRRNGKLAGENHYHPQPSQLDSAIPILLISRVSTVKSEQKTSLENQMARLQAYVAEQFGAAKVTIYRNLRQASGLNLSHPKFIEIIDLILSGKLDNGHILACWKDRLCRYGWEVVERLCQLRNITLKYIDEQDKKSEAEELQNDLLSVLTTFTAKANGNKVRKLYAVKIDENQAELIFRMRERNLGTKLIYSHLKELGKHLDCNGRQLSPTVLYRFLRRNGKIARKMRGLKTGIEIKSPANSDLDSLSQFIHSQHVQPTADTRIRFRDFYAAYAQWCQAEGLLLLPQNTTSTALRAKGYKFRYVDGGYLAIYCQIGRAAKVVHP